MSDIHARTATNLTTGAQSCTGEGSYRLCSSVPSVVKPCVALELAGLYQQCRLLADRYVRAELDQLICRVAGQVESGMTDLLLGGSGLDHDGRPSAVAAGLKSDQVLGELRLQGHQRQTVQRGLSDVAVAAVEQGLDRSEERHVEEERGS